MQNGKAFLYIYACSHLLSGTNQHFDGAVAHGLEDCFLLCVGIGIIKPCNLRARDAAICQPLGKSCARIESPVLLRLFAKPKVVENDLGTALNLFLVAFLVQVHIILGRVVAGHHLVTHFGDDGLVALFQRPAKETRVNGRKAPIRDDGNNRVWVVLLVLGRLPGA